MYSKQILEFIYSLSSHDIKIWVDGEDIKISLPKNSTEVEVYANFIKAHKDQIIFILDTNKIYSPNYHTLILGSND